MSTKLNNSIFGNLFYLVSNHFTNQNNLFTQYNEKFLLKNTNLIGELTYKKRNIILRDNTKIWGIQSYIIIKHEKEKEINKKIDIVESYILNGYNHKINEKLLIKKICYDKYNIQYCVPTLYDSLPKELIEDIINNNKEILSVSFQK